MPNFLVLDLTNDYAARIAALSYAERVNVRNPGLSIALVSHMQETETPITEMRNHETRFVANELAPYTSVSAGFQLTSAPSTGELDKEIAHLRDTVATLTAKNAVLMEAAAAAAAGAGGAAAGTPLETPLHAPYTGVSSSAGQGAAPAPPAPVRGVHGAAPVDYVPGKEAIVDYVQGKVAVLDDRTVTYGHRSINFDAGGRVIQGILENHWQMKLPEIPGRIVALINAGMKMVRMAHNGRHVPDTAFDINVYVDIAEELDPRRILSE